MLKLVVLIFACALVGYGQGNDDEKMDVFHLPQSTVPESYDLQIVPSFNGTDSKFSGVTKIIVSCVTTTNVITLNIKDLTVNNVTVGEYESNAVKSNLTLTGSVYQKKNEQFEINLEKSLIKSRKYLVTVVYEGSIRNDMTGFYLSSYEENNATKWLGVTQFEPTYARRAFPCYDEPSYKTVFNISIVKQKSHIALSNMPIMKTESGSDNTDIVYFQSTPVMSTYLTAFFIGEFVPNKNNTEVTVYTHKDYVDQTEYAGTEAPKHLKAMVNYTNISYRLPKMDLLAIPDFSAGAMENWGLNTYREKYILLDNESTTDAKISVSMVVQHEFVHQWFGDLVTCSWWDYTWLNEGFAAYFQYFATQLVRTDWPMEEYFLVAEYQNALEYDQKPRQPITASVNTPDEIEEIFDSITYSKAASILRMLKYLVTEKLFKLSLQNYLNKMAEQAAEPDDLFLSFDDVLSSESYHIENGLSVTDFMKNWTLQSGYPILNITKNNNTNIFSIIQRQFFIDASDYKEGNDSSWYIGLTYTTESSKNFSYVQPSAWTNQTSKLTQIPAPRDSGWYIFNIQSIGFYRVNYDAENWNLLIKQLNDTPTDIHLFNRAQLIDDAFALAKAGLLNYSVPLSLTQYLEKENNSLPWYVAKNSLSYLIDRMPRSEDCYEKFKLHVSNLAGTIYNKLDNLVSNGTREYNVTRAWSTFSAWACQLDNKDCTSRASQYFQKWLAGGKISADIKTAAFCEGVKNSTGSAIFNRMFSLYTTTKSISEKTSAEFALGCSTNRTQLTEYLNHLLDGPKGPIKEKDFNSVILSVSKTRLGFDVLNEFLSTNLNRLLKELSNGENVVTFIYSTLAYKATYEVEITQLKSLKDNTTLPASVSSSFNETFVNVVNKNQEWYDLYSNDIGIWVSENPEPITTTISPQTTISPTTPAPSTTSKPSKATSNMHNSFFILIFTLFSILFKKQVV